MTMGTWGSRLPIGNYLFSKCVFAGVRWRLALRPLLNAVGDLLRPRPVRLVNDDSTAEAMRRWLGKGYDKINVGGGPKNLNGFVNIDFVPHPNVEREVLANVLDLAFIPAACAAQIHTNHVVEHFTQDELDHQLREYHRILKERGLLTLRCPNALGAAYGFWFQPVIEDQQEAFVEAGFPADENFGNSADGWMHKDLYGLLHWFYGDMGNVVNQHLNRITPTKIRNSVESAGFQILRMTVPEAVNIVVVARKIRTNGQS